MTSFKQQLQETKEDITFWNTNGGLMKAVMMESIREDFRAKAAKPGVNPLKKLAYKAGIIATYAVF